MSELDGFFFNFYRVLPSIDRVLLGYTGFTEFSGVLIHFEWVLLYFLHFHRVFSGFTKFDRVSMGSNWSTGYYLFYIGFEWVFLGLPGFTGCYWDLLGIFAFKLGLNAFNLVSLGFTEFS